MAETGIKCPHCGSTHHMRTLETRKTSDGIKRRKECVRCLFRVTTTEKIVERTSERQRWADSRHVIGPALDVVFEGSHEKDTKKPAR